MPAVSQVEARCEGTAAGVVASHARHFSLAQGMILAPSGRKGEPGINPCGSLTAAIPALLSAL
jgi:hypothetical protein